jgi:HlyD family secretion protein
MGDQPPKKMSGQADEGAVNATREGRVWVSEGDFVRPISVRLGLTDGIMTEVKDGEVQPGMSVVVGESSTDPSVESGNPFAPKLPAKK